MFDYVRLKLNESKILLQMNTASCNGVKTKL